MKKILALTLAGLLGSSVTAQKLETRMLEPDVLLYTTYQHSFASHGLAVNTTEGIVLIDTPWDTTQLEPLLQQLDSLWGQPVILALATHFHEDRTGSFPGLQRRGIPTAGTALTDEWCRKEGEPRPQLILPGDTLLTLGGVEFRIYYPGPGHSPDNTVVWLRHRRLLHGGCFIKGMGSANLGNLSHADPEAWLMSLERMVEKFPDPRLVVPGHDGLNGAEPLAHTRKLLLEHLRD